MIIDNNIQFCSKYLTFTSPYCCPGGANAPGGGLSGGTILILLFVIVLAVYLIGGKS